MIVSPGRRYVFVHAPKTGGTALTLALEARAMKDDIIIADTPKGRRRRRRAQAWAAQAGRRLGKHARLAEVAPLIGEEALGRMMVVTLVRNPWDRLVSYWRWLRAQSFDHEAVRLARAHDFAAFLRHPATRAAVAASGYASYMRLPDGQERCDLWIRIERFAEDAAPFERHLGFALAPLPRANASDRPRDWRPFYDDALAELVAELCADDIARFGYAFDDAAGA